MSVDTKVTPIPADAFSVEEKTGDTPAVNGAEFAAAETAAKACDARSPLDVQTGPAVRNDFATKARHGDLLAFDLRLKNIYSTISQSIWETSKKI